MTEQIFTNATIVLGDALISGSVAVKDGIITDISEGPLQATNAIDLEGDILAPGLVELHTDALEKHMAPRPKAEWPRVAAVIAHDCQIASAGITTVFDAVALGDVDEDGDRVKRFEDMVNGVNSAQDKGLLRVDHLIHLRCEIGFRGMDMMLNKLKENPLVKMISVMDHTPGQRQFLKKESYISYYKAKYRFTDEEMDAFVKRRKEEQGLFGEQNRKLAVDTAHSLNIALASHDDATKEHVAEAVADKMTVAEFPTTIEAAKHSHEAGLAVMMGGPNLVRGGSHSGNISAGDLAKEGYLDVISSDYVPHSLLHGAFILHEKYDYTLPDAIARVSKTPAKSVGLDDRGEIAIGKRADLLHIHPTPDFPVIRGVWREGRRVC